MQKKIQQRYMYFVKINGYNGLSNTEANNVVLHILIRQKI